MGVYSLVGNACMGGILRHMHAVKALCTGLERGAAQQNSTHLHTLSMVRSSRLDLHCKRAKNVSRACPTQPLQLPRPYSDHYAACTHGQIFSTESCLASTPSPLPPVAPSPVHPSPCSRVKFWQTPMGRLLGTLRQCQEL